jgi:uncharacterized protein YceK
MKVTVRVLALSIVASATLGGCVGGLVAAATSSQAQAQSARAGAQYVIARLNQISPRVVRALQIPGPPGARGPQGGAGPQGPRGVPGEGGSTDLKNLCFGIELALDFPGLHQGEDVKEALEDMWQHGCL